MTGVVKNYFDRGFGFIIPDEGGSDVYFHARQFRGNEATICSTMRVRYELGPAQRGGTEAKNVTPLEVTR